MLPIFDLQVAPVTAYQITSLCRDVLASQGLYENSRKCCVLTYIPFLGPNMHRTSNCSMGIVFIGNMLSQLQKIVEILEKTGKTA